MEPAPLLYLSAADVTAIMPPVAQRIELARVALAALAAEAELPPKLGVHPRPQGAFAHAMPALLRGSGTAGDLLGVKWVSGFPGNAALGLPAIHGTVVLSDPQTGVPLAFVDAGPVTAHRTAAVSAVAMQLWAPLDPERDPLRVAMIGAGVQAGSHVPVVAHLLPTSSLVLYDRHQERAEDLAREALRLGIAKAEAAPDAEAAIGGADIVITFIPFGPQRGSLSSEALDGAALIIAVDYDMCVRAATAANAALFVVDEIGQFLGTRASGDFEGYPDPTTTIGQALHDHPPRPNGTVLVTHLGVGLVDLVFADALRRAALERAIGTVLPR